MHSFIGAVARFNSFYRMLAIIKPTEKIAHYYIQTPFRVYLSFYAMFGGVA